MCLNYCLFSWLVRLFVSVCLVGVHLFGWLPLFGCITWYSFVFIWLFGDILLFVCLVVWFGWFGWFGCLFGWLVVGLVVCLCVCLNYCAFVCLICAFVCIGMFGWIAFVWSVAFLVTLGGIRLFAFDCLVTFCCMFVCLLVCSGVCLNYC